MHILKIECLNTSVFFTCILYTPEIFCVIAELFDMIARKMEAAAKNAKRITGNTCLTSLRPRQSRSGYVIAITVQ